MSKLDEIRSRKVYSTRTHDPDEYSFNVIKDVLRLRQKNELKETARVLDLLQSIQKLSIRQLMASGYGNTAKIVDECLEDEDILSLSIDDHALAQIIAFASMYRIDNTNVWHIANVAAMSMVLESKVEN